MTEMLERVARAVSFTQEGPCDPEIVARMAVEAMRKPTDAMLLSAGDDYWDADIHWRRMIDAALSHADGKPTDA